MSALAVITQAVVELEAELERVKKARDEAVDEAVALRAGVLSLLNWEQCRDMQRAILARARPGVDPADMGRCSSCKAPVRWVVTQGGKSMPVDYEPSPTGNLVLAQGKDEKIHSQAFDPAKHGDRRRWVSHFATCANAKTHRKAT